MFYINKDVAYYHYTYFSLYCEDHINFSQYYQGTIVHCPCLRPSLVILFHQCQTKFSEVSGVIMQA
jgi:hypothetical protein